MRVTYRWIQEYVKADLSPKEMAEQFVRIGHEVESIIDLGMIDNPICVGRITNCEPHPDADRLSVCRVDDGSGEEKTVVCGAPNAREGIKGIFAKVGATLPGGQTMKRARIRGVKSEGMLLAPDEAGMGNDHKGIIEIEDETLEIGVGYDVIYDLEITPNRPDCLSVWGLARDLAASLG
ncbi:MAG: YtpR family tRNA-binding protein, partial [Candidatus Sumerlaeota bacterium]